MEQRTIDLRNRWNRRMEDRPSNARTAGFWGSLPEPRAEYHASTGPGPYETRYDVSLGYSAEREIVLP